MTKQKIIDLMKEKEKDGGILFFQKSGEDFATELLAMFEQEKKEQVREIFEKLYPCISRGAVTYTIWAKDIEEIAKEC